MTNIKAGFEGNDAMRSKAARLLGDMSIATQQRPMSKSAPSLNPYRRPYKEGGPVLKELESGGAVKLEKGGSTATPMKKGGGCRHRAYEEGGPVVKKLESGGPVSMEKGGIPTPMAKGGSSAILNTGPSTATPMKKGGGCRHHHAMGGVAKIRHNEATSKGMPLTKKKSSLKGTF